MEIVPVEWNGKEVINPPRSWIEGILTAVSQIFEMGRDRDDRSSNNFFHQDSSYLRSIGKKGNYISFHDLRCIRVVSMLTTYDDFSRFFVDKIGFLPPLPLFFRKIQKNFRTFFSVGFPFVTRRQNRHYCVQCFGYLFAFFSPLIFRHVSKRSDR